MKGDSGGPVFEYQIKPGQGLEAVLIGVVDFTGTSCSTIQIEPTGFANVGFHRNWIEAQVRN